MKDIGKQDKLETNPKRLIGYHRQFVLSIISFVVSLVGFLIYDHLKAGISLDSLWDNIFQAIGISILFFFAGSYLKTRKIPHKSSLPASRKTVNYIAAYLLLTVFFAGLYAALQKEWLAVFNCALVFATLFNVQYIEFRYDIFIPLNFKFVVLIFLYMSLYLGEVHAYYYKFFWWDIVLHFSSALVIGLVGFLMIYIIFRRNNIRSSYFITGVFSFNFAVTVGAVWEIIEFSIDQIFGANMQKSGLVDTMWDLIIDAIGALLVSVSCYLYIRYNRRGIMTDIVKEFVDSNPKIINSSHQK